MKEAFSEQFKRTAENGAEAEKKTAGVAQAADGLLGRLDQYAFSEEAGISVADYLARRIAKDEFQERLKALEEKEANIQKARERLQSEGYITAKDERGNLVVDLEKLRRISLKNDTALGRSLAKYAGEKDRYGALYRIFKNCGVISKEDFENGVREPKSLMFSPKTKEEALSPANLKGDNFYFSSLDFAPSSGKSRGVRLARGWEPYPSLADKSLSRLEAATLLLIYNKNYGDGYRDENGVLLVRDPDTGEYKRISTGFFEKHAFHPTGKRETDTESRPSKTIANNPRSFIKKFLPNIGADLLSLEDFRMISGSPSAEKERMTREIMRPGRKQYVMLNRVKHYLGPEFQGRHVKIYQISEDLAGIADVDAKTGEEEELTHIFNILRPKEGLKTKKGSYIASKKETDLRKYDEKDFFARRPDEEEADYGKRVEAMRDFIFMMNFSRDLAQRAGIDLRKWTLEEQKVVSAAVKTFDYAKNREKILNFAERFGEDGLKTFLTAEYDMKNGQKILEISESISEEEAEAIFAEYGKILGAAGSFRNIFDKAKGIRDSGLPPELKNAFPGEIREAIIRRSKDVLMALYPIAVEKRQTQLNIKDVAVSLQGLRTFLEVAIALSGDRSGYKVEKVSALSDRSFVFAVSDSDNLQYKFKIFIRPLEEKTFRAGQEYIDQARINFELDFNTEKPNEGLKEAFKQTQYDTLEKKLKTQHQLRVGIDRDVIGRESPERKISMDLGRSELRGERVERSGDVLGRVLQLTTETGHHNPKSFDQRFAKEEHFREIAELFRSYLESMVKIRRG